mgnify:CR=1 FL=1|jgi:hypothetical protein
MKRLTFKKPFNGMDSALKLIPESYKVDGKEFQITDGTETYNIRWDINEATVLIAENKNLINEDMNKIKHLMGFKSQDTLGTLKGEERLNENKSFTDVWNKTKDISEAGQAFGMGFSNEGNLEENEPMKEMERVEEEVYEEEKIEELSLPDAVDFATGFPFAMLPFIATALGVSVAVVKHHLKNVKSPKEAMDKINAIKNSGEASINESVYEEESSEEVKSTQVSVADIRKDLKTLLYTLNKADFKAKERMVVGKLMDMIQQLGGEEDSFSPRLTSKLDLVQQALDDKSGEPESNNVEAGEEESVYEEKDRFDEIFEDMYKEELSQKQSEVMDTDGDGDIDADDLANLRNK